MLFKVKSSNTDLSFGLRRVFLFEFESNQDSMIKVYYELHIQTNYKLLIYDYTDDD